MVLNSAALAEAGVDRTTPDPDGGHVDRAADSDEPTGLLRERAMEFARRVVQQPGPDALERAILDAGAANLRLGITSVWEPSVEPPHIEAYERLEAESRLPVRVTMAQKKVLRSGEAVELAAPVPTSVAEPRRSEALPGRCARAPDGGARASRTQASRTIGGSSSGRRRTWTRSWKRRIAEASR